MQKIKVCRHYFIWSTRYNFSCLMVTSIISINLELLFLQLNNPNVNKAVKMKEERQPLLISAADTNTENYER